MIYTSTKVQFKHSYVQDVHSLLVCYCEPSQSVYFPCLVQVSAGQGHFTCVTFAPWPFTWPSHPATPPVTPQPLPCPACGCAKLRSVPFASSSIGCGRQLQTCPLSFLGWTGWKMKLSGNVTVFRCNFDFIVHSSAPPHHSAFLCHDKAASRWVWLLKGGDSSGRDSSAVRAPDSWLKGHRFESLLVTNLGINIMCAFDPVCFMFEYEM